MSPTSYQLLYPAILRGILGGASGGVNLGRLSRAVGTGFGTGAMPIDSADAGPLDVCRRANGLLDGKPVGGAKVEIKTADGRCGLPSCACLPRSRP